MNTLYYTPYVSAKNKMPENYFNNDKTKYKMLNSLNRILPRGTIILLYERHIQYSQKRFGLDFMRILSDRILALLVFWTTNFWEN